MGSEVLLVKKNINLKQIIGGLRSKFAMVLTIGGIVVSLVFFLGFFKFPENFILAAPKLNRAKFFTSSVYGVVKIYAAGTPARGVYPTMRLLINGRRVKSFRNITGDPYNRIFNEYTHTSRSDLRGQNLSVEFINDAYIGGQDRNLMVDRIVVADITHETETQSTYSTGTFDSINNCAPGYKMSEWLNCNGQFDYHPKDNYCQMFPTDNRCNVNKLNTINWNDSPFMSGDGQLFYFMDISWDLWSTFSGGVQYYTGLVRPGHTPDRFSSWAEKAGWFVSAKNPNGSWSAPTFVRDDMCCAMTQDNQAFVYQTEVQPGDNNIVLAVRYPDGTWSPPQDFGPSINTSYIEDNPHLSPDNNFLVWTSNRPGGYGGNDLWISVKLPDGSWLPALNMGPNVNTAEEEDQAWMSADNGRIYFNRGLTIMVTQNVGGIWTTPQALAFPQPVAGGEPSLTYDEQVMALAVLDQTTGDITFSISYRQPNGTWSMPVPVD